MDFNHQYYGGFVVDLFKYDFNADDYLENINNNGFVSYLKLFNYLSYGVIVIFIYLFYKNYIRISTIASTKQLMKDILKTRKTVQYYVWYNLAMIGVLLIIGFVIAFTILKPLF
jgi:hypothetical protein